jgi:hypothetical protein
MSQAIFPAALAALPRQDARRLTSEACVVADCDAQRLRLRKIAPPRIISVWRRARERPLAQAMTLIAELRLVDGVGDENRSAPAMYYT